MSKVRGSLRERLAEVELGDEIVLERQPGFWDGFDLEKIKKHRARYGGGGFNDEVDAMLLDTLDDTVFDGPAPDEGEWTSRWLEALGRVAIKDQWSLKERVRLWDELLKRYIKEERFGVIMGVYLKGGGFYVGAESLSQLGLSFRREVLQGMQRASLRPGSDASSRYDRRMPKNHLLANEVGMVLESALAMAPSKRRTQVLRGIARSGRRLYANMRDYPFVEYRKKTWEHWVHLSEELAKEGRADMALDLLWHTKEMVGRWGGRDSSGFMRVHEVAGTLLEGYCGYSDEVKAGVLKRIEPSCDWSESLIGGSISKVRSEIAMEKEQDRFNKSLEEAYVALTEPGVSMEALDFQAHSGREFVNRWGVLWRGISQGDKKLDDTIKKHWKAAVAFKPKGILQQWNYYSRMAGEDIPQEYQIGFARQAMDNWFRGYKQVHKDSYPAGLHGDGFSIKVSHSLLGCVIHLEKAGEAGRLVDGLNGAVDLHLAWFTQKVKKDFAKEGWGEKEFDANARTSLWVLSVIVKDIKKYVNVEELDGVQKRLKGLDDVYKAMQEAKSAYGWTARGLEMAKEASLSKQLGASLDGLGVNMGKLLKRELLARLEALGWQSLGKEVEQPL